MRTEVRNYRRLAAQHLWRARLAETSGDRELRLHLARGFKFLAHDTERRHGDPERSIVQKNQNTR
jgi:hypothetical protein